MDARKARTDRENAVGTSCALLHPPGLPHRLREARVPEALRQHGRELRRGQRVADVPWQGRRVRTGLPPEEHRNPRFTPLVPCLSNIQFWQETVDNLRIGTPHCQGKIILQYVLS